MHNAHIWSGLQKTHIASYLRELAFVLYPQLSFWISKLKSNLNKNEINHKWKMQHQRGVVQKMHFEDVTQQIIYGNTLHNILTNHHITLTKEGPRKKLQFLCIAQRTVQTRWHCRLPIHE